MKFSATLFQLLSLAVVQGASSVVPLEALVAEAAAEVSAVAPAAVVSATDAPTDAPATAAPTAAPTAATTGIASVAAVEPLFAVEPTEAISAVVTAPTTTLETPSSVSTAPVDSPPPVPAWASNSPESDALAHPTVAPFDPPVQANSAAHVVAGLFIAPLLIALLLV